MTFQRSLLLVAAGVVALGACSDSATTAPDATAQKGAEVGKSDTSATDTVPHLAASFNVSGRVLAVSRTTASSGSSDTVQVEPIAGAAITIYRNVLVNGTATQVLAAKTTSAAGGEYRVNGLAGGYYVVQAAAPAGSPYADNFAYLAGTASEVKADVYLWRRP